MPRNVKLADNEGIVFSGIEKGGAFDVAEELARSWLDLPDTPPAADVLRPWIDSDRLALGQPHGWIIDFGLEMSEAEAARYRAPFAWLSEHVRPLRSNWKAMLARYWWRHAEPRLRFRAAITGKKRYLATSRRARHSIFQWVDATVLPDSSLVLLACDQDALFAVLHSRFHRLWTLRQIGPSEAQESRYAPTVFETFPLPETLDVNGGFLLGPVEMHKLAEAGNRLDRLREQWLKLPQVYDDERGTDRPRTLLSLYDETPPWLVEAHAAVDQAVARAYGWPASIGDEEAMARLDSLNYARPPQRKLGLALSA